MEDLDPRGFLGFSSGFRDVFRHIQKPGLRAYLRDPGLRVLFVQKYAMTSIEHHQLSER